MKTLISSLVIVCVLGCFSCQKTNKANKTDITDQEVAEIIQTFNDEYANAWMNGEVEKCLSMMTPDYVNYLTYDNTQNRKKVEDMFYNMAKANSIANASFDRIEIFIHEDMAYEFGYLTQDITPKNGGETTTSRSRYITVFKKINDKWLFHRWMPQPEIE